VLAIQHCYKYSSKIQGTLQGLHARFTDLDEKLDKRLPAVYQEMGTIHDSLDHWKRVHEPFSRRR